MICTCEQIFFANNMHLSASIHDNIGVNVYLDKDKCVYAETNPYISYTYLFVCE